MGFDQCDLSVAQRGRGYGFQPMGFVGWLKGGRGYELQPMAVEMGVAEGRGYGFRPMGVSGGCNRKWGVAGSGAWPHTGPSPTAPGSAAPGAAVNGGF